MRLPRRTGALSGLLVILLGAWGGLIPFVGPYFHYAFGNFDRWHYTTNRLWLDILPGAVAVLGGLILLSSSRRTSGVLGGWVAVAAGAWFAIGPTVSLLWHRAGDPIGRPTGGHIRQTAELLGYFHGLGVLIVALVQTRVPNGLRGLLGDPIGFLICAVSAAVFFAGVVLMRRFTRIEV